MAEPKLRFKDENGRCFSGWKKVKFSSLFTETNIRKRQDLEALTVVQGSGTVKRSQSDRNLIYDKTNLDKYKYVNVGEFIVHLRSFEGGLELSQNEGIVSPAYHILNGNGINQYFYYLYFRSKNFITGPLKTCVVGIRDGRSIEMKSLMKAEIPYADIKEQSKIAAFLSSIDSKLEIEQKELDNLELAKKGFMQKIFSQELRFKDDNGNYYPDWEEKFIGDLGEVAMCKRIFKEQTSSSGDIPFFKIGTFGGEPDAFITKDLFNEFKQKYKYPKKGTPMISASGTIGRIVIYNGEDAYYQDSNIIWLEHDNSVLDMFLEQFYKQVKWNDLLEGTTIKRLYNKNFYSLVIEIPCIEEQEKIAAFLSSIDSLIDKQRKIVEDWKEIKKGFLQQLFPSVE